MSTKKGIGYSELSERVYLGRQNREKGMWIGEKEDITSDFLNVANAYFTEGTCREVTTSDGKINLMLNIKKDEESIKRCIKHLQKLLK